MGAWWAAVSGVTQSRTRLKRLSSSSSLSSQMTAQKFRRRSTVTGSGAASWRRLYLWQLEEVLGKSISLGAAACFWTEHVSSTVNTHQHGRPCLVLCGNVSSSLKSASGTPKRKAGRSVVGSSQSRCPAPAASGKLSAGGSPGIPQRGPLQVPGLWPQDFAGRAAWPQISHPRAELFPWVNLAPRSCPTIRFQADTHSAHR